MPDHCDCDKTEPSNVTVEISSGPQWMDAPCCEGYWWYDEESRWKFEVVKIVSPNGYLVAYEDGLLKGLGLFAGRWYGPILPPEPPE